MESNNVELQEIKREIIDIKKEIVTLKDDIKKDYNKINVNIDKMYKMLSELNVAPTNNAVVSPPKENLVEKLFTFPLTSCEQIEALDTEIRNNFEFKSQLVIIRTFITTLYHNYCYFRLHFYPKLEEQVEKKMEEKLHIKSSIRYSTLLF